MFTPALIVLTNDDGIDAPGLDAMARATDGLDPRAIFAPLLPQSGCGHVVTTHRAVVVAKRADLSTSVEGTPADCVRMALLQHGADVAWVLSGINAGGNLGSDIHHSGTVAAVREAAIHGRSGIAISQYIARGRAIDWEQSARWAKRVLAELLLRPPASGTFWNVNLPHPAPGSAEPSIVHCPADPSPLPLSYRPEPDGLVYSGDYQGRARLPGTDVDVCFRGSISVTNVRVLASVDPQKGF